MGSPKPEFCSRIDAPVFFWSREEHEEPRSLRTVSPCDPLSIVYDDRGHVPGASHRVARRALGGPERFGQALLVLLTFFLGSVSDASASERRLRVLGSTTLEARITSSTHDRMRLEGNLTDDAGRPVSAALVRLRVDGGMPDTVVACPSGEPPRRAGADLLLPTGTGGRFCVELKEELEGTPLHLAYEDDAGFLGSVTLDLTATPAPRALDLLLTAPNELPLDTPLHVLEVAVVPRTEGDAEVPEEAPRWTPVAVELVLEAPHREQRSLGEVEVVPGERGRLEISASELGLPGAAVLVARFEGNTRWAPAEAARRVSKTAQVRVDAPPTLRVDAHGGPATLPVRVRWTRGAVPSGTVEAFWGDQPVGAGPVSGGAGTVGLTLSDALLESLGASDADGRGARLTLGYVPNAPWWTRGTPAEVELIVAPPSPWSWLPWLLAGSGMLAWVSIIWWRPGRRSSRAAPVRAPGPPGRAALEIIDGQGEALAGQIFDAHTGAAIRGARIEVLQPSMEDVTVLLATRTAEDGSFHLDLEAVWSPAVESAGPRIRVRADGYSTLQRPLPRRGRLVIHLAELRRAILERLLAWAQRKGAPWQGRVPPTPAHIARIAENQAARRTAEWARNVEEAAFGPIPPDERAEKELREGEPP